MLKQKLVWAMIVSGCSSFASVCTANAQAIVETLSAGQQIGVEVVQSSDVITTTSTTLAAVPNASLSWTTRKSVLIEVDLTAECRLIGGDVANEWIEVYANISSSIPVDGFPRVLEPGADAGSPMAFCSADIWAAHSASWATLVPSTPGSYGPVTYTVEIMWRNNVTGNTAWLDDWKMTLHVSEKPE